MKVVPVDVHGESVTVTGPIRHLCPFRDEIDVGSVEVSWRVDGVTFELHDLAAYFASFSDVRISHEELTDRILRDLSPWAVNVTTAWSTADLEVKVSRSREGGVS